MNDFYQKVNSKFHAKKVDEDEHKYACVQQMILLNAERGRMYFEYNVLSLGVVSRLKAEGFEVIRREPNYQEPNMNGWTVSWDKK